MTKTAALYERIGGEEGVKRLVEQFYDRVLQDEELAPFFKSTPMEKLQNMQFEFFSAALDGPIQYTGQPIHYVHKGRGIRAKHLRRFMDHLLATLEAIHPNDAEVYDMISRISLYADSVMDGPVGDSE